MSRAPESTPSSFRSMARATCADPPWDVHQRGPHTADQHYDTAPDQIKAMPVMAAIEAPSGELLRTKNQASKK